MAVVAQFQDTRAVVRAGHSHWAMTVVVVADYSNDVVHPDCTSVGQVHVAIAAAVE